MQLTFTRKSNSLAYKAFARASRVYNALHNESIYTKQIETFEIS